MVLPELELDESAASEVDAEGLFASVGEGCE